MADSDDESTTSSSNRQDINDALAKTVETNFIITDVAGNNHITYLAYPQDATPEQVQQLARQAAEAYVLKRGVTLGFDIHGGSDIKMTLEPGTSDTVALQLTKSHITTQELARAKSILEITPDKRIVNVEQELANIHKQIDSIQLGSGQELGPLRNQLVQLQADAAEREALLDELLDEKEHNEAEKQQIAVQAAAVQVAGGSSEAEERRINIASGLGNFTMAELSAILAASDDESVVEPPAGKHRERDAKGQFVASTGAIFGPGNISKAKKVKDLQSFIKNTINKLEEADTDFVAIIHTLDRIQKGNPTATAEGNLIADDIHRSAIEIATWAEKHISGSTSWLSYLKSFVSKTGARQRVIDTGAKQRIINTSGAGMGLELDDSSEEEEGFEDMYMRPNLAQFALEAERQAESTGAKKHEVSFNAHKVHGGGKTHVDFMASGAHVHRNATTGRYEATGAMIQEIEGELIIVERKPKSSPLIRWIFEKAENLTDRAQMEVDQALLERIVEGDGILVPTVDQFLAIEPRLEAKWAAKQTNQLREGFLDSVIAHIPKFNTLGSTFAERIGDTPFWRTVERDVGQPQFQAAYAQFLSHL